MALKKWEEESAKRLRSSIQARMLKSPTINMAYAHHLENKPRERNSQVRKQRRRRKHNHKTNRKETKFFCLSLLKKWRQISQTSIVLCPLQPVTPPNPPQGMSLCACRRRLVIRKHLRTSCSLCMQFRARNVEIWAGSHDGTLDGIDGFGTLGILGKGD